MARKYLEANSFQEEIEKNSNEFFMNTYTTQELLDIFFYVVIQHTQLCIENMDLFSCVFGMGRKF